jgi:L-arabinonolactonase
MLEQGGLVLALESGFALFDAVAGRIDRVASVEADLPSTRLNDGRVDPAGRFISGGMDEAERQQPLSAVYALNRDRSVRQVLGGIHCSNSICWSPDSATFYFTDMPSRRIDAFDYDATTGTVANRRMFASLREEPGLADGSVVDAEGYLWNAQRGGGKIVRYAPTGAVDREVALPTSNPTCLAFGGPDLDVLFVTTARLGLDAGTLAAQPQAGNLLAFRPGVRGLPEKRYVG